MFKRGNFRAGTKFKGLPSSFVKAVAPETLREGISESKEIKRPGFRVEGPRPKKIKGLKQLEQEIVRREGAKVRLDEGLLGEVSVPKTDAEGNIIKNQFDEPVMEKKKMTFGLLHDIIEKGTQENIAKISELTAQLRAGVGNPQEKKEELAVRVLDVIDDEDITPGELTIISDGVEELDLPSEPEENKLPDIVTRESYKGKGGMIKTLLVKNAREIEGLTSDRPLWGVSDLSIKLTSLDSLMSRGKQVIDLRDSTMKKIEDLDDEDLELAGLVQV